MWLSSRLSSSSSSLDGLGTLLLIFILLGMAGTACISNGHNGDGLPTEGPDVDGTDADGEDQEYEEIWDGAREVLDSANLTDFVVIVGDEQGVLFVYESGNATLDTPMSLASASKLPAAVTILALAERGEFELDDYVRDFLPFWTDDPDDRRSQVTIRQTLSYTAGFKADSMLSPLCPMPRRTSMIDCGRYIYENGSFATPGEVYTYGPANHQLGAVAAVAASGESWESLFSRLVVEPLGLSSAAGFPGPTPENPRVAGGGQMTPKDYGLLLHGLMRGAIIPDLLDELFADQIGELPMEDLPATIEGYSYRYALGNWVECSQGEWSSDCAEKQINSSPGLLGTYPWVDQYHQYWAILAREDRGAGAVAASGEVVEALRPVIIRALELEEERSR